MLRLLAEEFRFVQLFLHRIADMRVHVREARAVCRVIGAVQHGIEHGGTDPDVISDLDIHAVLRGIIGDAVFVMLIGLCHNVKLHVQIPHKLIQRCALALRAEFPEILKCTLSLCVTERGHASRPSANALRFISMNFAGTH